MSLAVFLQYVMPHRFFSRLAYYVARNEWRPFKNWLIALVVRKFNVNMSEAEVSDPLSYKSFNQFFTRALKPGARIADADPDSLLIPADGKISQVGRIKDGDIFQAKGHRYSTTALVGGDAALVSWSGSMFEYLMPMLVMPSYENTLLDETMRGAVERQVRYGRQRGVPWGISESGYNAADAQLIASAAAVVLCAGGAAALARAMSGACTAEAAPWHDRLTAAAFEAAISLQCADAVAALSAGGLRARRCADSRRPDPPRSHRVHECGDLAVGPARL